MIKAEREAMQRVGNFVTVGGKLREIGAHARQLSRSASQSQSSDEVEDQKRDD
jgi:hypothetical protein